MSKSVVLDGRIEEGSYWSTLVGSVGAHLIFLAAAIALPMIFPVTPITPGSGGGGGGGGDEGIIPVNLVAPQLGGGTGAYKPVPHAEPPAVDLPKPQEKKAEPEAVPIPDPFTTTKKSKKEAPPKKATSPSSEESRTDKEPPNLSPKQQKVKDPAKLPGNYIPGPTGIGKGGIGAPGSGTHGVGIGLGDGPGTGGGSGIGNSWYAGVVEKRIGSNWLRSLFGNVPSGKFTAIFSFQVLDNGAIAGVNMVKSSGISTLDDSARRAIAASNPLTPLPPELRGKPVRFTAYFEYPPPK